MKLLIAACLGLIIGVAHCQIDSTSKCCKAVKARKNFCRGPAAKMSDVMQCSAECQVQFGPQACNRNTIRTYRKVGLRTVVALGPLCYGTPHPGCTTDKKDNSTNSNNPSIIVLRTDGASPQRNGLNSLLPLIALQGGQGFAPPVLPATSSATSSNQPAILPIVISPSQQRAILSKRVAAVKRMAAKRRAVRNRQNRKQ